MRQDLVLGIDGGGTSTVAWLARPGGEVIGRGEAGPSNLKTVGIGPGLAALDEAIGEAFRQTRGERRPVASACLGLAGFDRPEDRLALERWNARGRHANRLRLVNDGELVIAAGTPDGWGIGLISGTGSICVGRGPDGRTARAGGWGPLFGDEGSAYAIAVDGLRLTAQRADSRITHAPGLDFLTGRICSVFNIEGAQGLINAIYGQSLDRASLARLAPLVVEADHDGDAGAHALIEQAAEDLSLMVLTVARAIGFSSEDLPPIAFAGGFLLGSGSLRSLLVERLESCSGGRVVVDAVEDPVAGAVALACRELTQI